jgi:competence protein ComEC
MFLCLWRGGGRWIGLPFAAAVLLWPRAPAPDVWIGDEGSNAAFRRQEEAVVVRPGVGEFAVELWSRRRGLTPIERSGERWTCSRYACRPGPDQDAAPVALWWGRKAPDAQAISAMCEAASIVSIRAVVAALPPTCAGRLVLDGVDFERGAVELWRGADSNRGWTARWSGDVRGDRPWSRRPDPDFSDSGA